MHATLSCIALKRIKLKITIGEINSRWDKRKLWHHRSAGQCLSLLGMAITLTFEFLMVENPKVKITPNIQEESNGNVIFIYSNMEQHNKKSFLLFHYFSYVVVMYSLFLDILTVAKRGSPRQKASVCIHHARF